MPEGELIHYYNVVTGQIACGLKLIPGAARTVFPDRVTCPICLKMTRQHDQKPAVQTN